MSDQRTLGQRLQISLGESITLSARNTPDVASFILDDGSQQTFAQTNARVNRLVSALRTECGVRPGDRIAVFALDSHRYVEIVLFNRYDGGSSGAISKILNKNGLGSTAWTINAAAVLKLRRLVALLLMCASLRGVVVFQGRHGVAWRGVARL